ncbi:hypothetical protein BJ741DRAFT_612076 [Chytriomyces cf. hyalinus JEL632]|nr:hypothetical protein BJ741DRAFT_612076 [Chytriomyces cf. hyalinus JEL632]
MNLILFSCLLLSALLGFVHCQKNLAPAQIRFLNRLSVVINALPPCAQYCLYLVDPTASQDTLQFISDICVPGGYQNFANTFNACVTDRSNQCVDAEKLALSQSFIASVPSNCTQLKSLFDPSETRIASFPQEPSISQRLPLPSDDGFLRTSTSAASSSATSGTQPSTQITQPPAASFALASSVVSAASAVASSSTSKPALSSGIRASSILESAGAVFILLAACSVL